jgi:thiol-disulfide isomerase/thioredoxin
MKRIPIPAIFALIGIAAVAALYGMVGRQGNVAQDNSCGTNDTFISTTLAPLATGEVAAFQPAAEPQDLSGLAFTTEDGSETSLKDFSGKVALVNLWATWCAPCRREMPALDRLQAELGGERFQVVPVNIDTGGVDKPKAFLASIEVKNLPLYRDPTTDIFQDIRKRGLGFGLPVTILVDEKGCQLGHMAGPAEWASDDAKALIKAAVER